MVVFLAFLTNTVSLAFRIRARTIRIDFLVVLHNFSLLRISVPSRILPSLRCNMLYISKLCVIGRSPPWFQCSGVRQDGTVVYNDLRPEN
jgi:hypothetical protein